MNRHDEIAATLPWYVNGTAGPADRAAVEAHLGECPRCRGAVDIARDLERALAHDPLLGHPAAAALVDHALGAGTLADDEFAAVEAHLARCAICREASDAVRASVGPPGAGAGRDDDETRRPADRARPSTVRSVLPDWLTATVLHPAAALAYLVVLAILVPVALRSDRDVPPVGSVVSPVRLHDPGALRGGTDATVEMVPVELDPAAAFVAFDLITDFDLDPWDGGDARASIVTPHGATLWSAAVAHEDVDGLGVIRLIVAREALAGHDRLDVRIDAPDGTTRFRAAIAPTP